MASGVATVEERIARQRDALTPTERKLATMLVEDPTGWAFSTVAELAREASTSGPTVVRFAMTLGFAGFSELQGRMRADVSARLRRPSDRIRQTHDPIDHTSALDAINATFDRLDDNRLESIARHLADADDRVWVIASESSSPVAQLLATNLGLLRPGVIHLAGSSPSTAAAIIDASASDAAIAIDFPRYEHTVVELASALAASGVEVTALTDGPLSPLVSIATDWCSVVVPPIGPFDSAASTVAVAEVIIARVATRLGSAATDRLDDVERRWSANGVFVPVATDSPNRKRR